MNEEKLYARIEKLEDLLYAKDERILEKNARIAELEGLYAETREALTTEGTLAADALNREQDLLVRIAELEAEIAALKAGPAFNIGDRVQIVAKTRTREFSPHGFDFGEIVTISGLPDEEGPGYKCDGDNAYWYVLACDILPAP